MDTKCDDTPTPQSRDSRGETREITRIYKAKRVTQPTTATLLESITVEGKANGEERARNGESESERNSSLSLSRGKRRAPATSSLTAVNGRSLRRSTARERGRENKRLRQMDGDSGGEEMGKGRRGEEARGKVEKRKKKEIPLLLEEERPGK